MTSEMFLSIITLLQTNLPCSSNYYRYKKNYESFGQEGVKKEGDSTLNDKDVIKTIASPRLMSKLSPINSFVQNQGINVNPMSQKGLLKYALNKPSKDKKNEDSSDDDGDYSKF